MSMYYSLRAFNSYVWCVYPFWCINNFSGIIYFIMYVFTKWWNWSSFCLSCSFYWFNMNFRFIFSGSSFLVAFWTLGQNDFLGETCFPPWEVQSKESLSHGLLQVPGALDNPSGSTYSCVFGAKAYKFSPPNNPIGSWLTNRPASGS